METKSDRIKGKRILIVGSIPDTGDVEKANFAHELVKNLAKLILVREAGLVITLGSEPRMAKKPSCPKIFDWTILEAVDELKQYPSGGWPSIQGMPVIAVGFADWEKRIPKDRQALWDRLFLSNKVELQIIPKGLNAGGVMRQEQSKYGDILFTLGGNIGVYHLSQLFQSARKPVVPSNLSFDNGEETASEILASQASTHPYDFFEYQPKHASTTAFSQLSFIQNISPVEFGRRFLDFVGHLPPPTAFNIRLLNPKFPHFKEVERFFRNVVDPAVSKMGYRRFEMETDASEQPFMNLELFEKLHFSSLVIADLTDVRPNCCFELGYALALGKKVIVTAMEGTDLSWDADKIHCHFWSTTKSQAKRTKELQLFIEKNINRASLVH